MKKCAAILCALVLLMCSEASAQSQQKFPAQIENYTLDANPAHFDSHCEQYMGENLCQEYWSAHYIGPNNKRVAVYLHNVSNGMFVYRQRLTGGEKIKLSSYPVYKIGGEISWLLQDEASVDGFDFNGFKAIELNATPIRTGGLNLAEDQNAKGNNPVAKYFIGLYPPNEKVLKKETPKFNTKEMKITVTSPTSNDVLVAGEDYEIKWKTKKVPSHLQIRFQLMYGNGGMSVGESVPNTGSYMWKVPVQYAQMDLKATPYKLVALVAGFDGADSVYDYSDSFAIFPSGSKEIYPITIDTHTENEVWKWGTSQTIQWRELNSISSYTVSLVKEGEKDGTIIKKVKSSAMPFVKQVKWKIDKKTAPGKYFWKIEGFNKNKLIAESASDVFEVVR